MNVVLAALAMASAIMAAIVIGSVIATIPKHAQAENPILYKGTHLQVVFINSPADFKTVDDLISQGWRINGTDAFAESYSTDTLRPGHYVFMTK